MEIKACADRNYSLEMTIDWGNDGAVSVNARHESQSAITFYEYHGHQASYGLPDAVSQRDWDALIGELRPLIGRVVAGYESVWDGNNHVARLDDDAAEAREEIEQAIQEWSWDEIVVWEAEEWLEASISYRGVDGKCCRRDDAASVYLDADTVITHETTDETLDDYEAQMLSYAEDSHIVSGLGYYLYELRDTCRRNFEQAVEDGIEELDEQPEPATLADVHIAGRTGKSAEKSAAVLAEYLDHVDATLPAIPARDPLARKPVLLRMREALADLAARGDARVRVSRRSGDVIFTEIYWPRWMPVPERHNYAPEEIRGGKIWVGTNDHRLSTDLDMAAWQMHHAGVDY